MGKAIAGCLREDHWGQACKRHGAMTPRTSQQSMRRGAAAAPPAAVVLATIVHESWVRHQRLAYTDTRTHGRSTRMCHARHEHRSAPRKGDTRHRVANTRESRQAFAGCTHLAMSAGQEAGQPGPPPHGAAGKQRPPGGRQPPSHPIHQQLNGPGPPTGSPHPPSVSHQRLGAGQRAWCHWHQHTGVSFNLATLSQAGRAGRDASRRPPPAQSLKASSAVRQAGRCARRVSTVRPHDAAPHTGGAAAQVTPPRQACTYSFMGCGSPVGCRERRGGHWGRNKHLDSRHTAEIEGRNARHQPRAPLRKAVAEW